MDLMLDFINVSKKASKILELHSTHLITEDSTLLCSASDTVCRAMASLAAICFFFRLFRLWDGDHSCWHNRGIAVFVTKPSVRHICGHNCKQLQHDPQTKTDWEKGDLHTHINETKGGRRFVFLSPLVYILVHCGYKSGWVEVVINMEMRQQNGARGGLLVLLRLLPFLFTLWTIFTASL